MKILAVAQVENRSNLDKQLAKQTINPDVFVYIDSSPVEGVNARRDRIAQNHQMLVEAVEENQPDFVWQLEQDVVLPTDCLERLVSDYNLLSALNNDDYFGYVSGAQVGRHGIYCIGAWHVGDDTFQSVDPHLKGLQEVDATGFYCLLAPTTVWLQGRSSWNGEPWGPDVNWGLSLKQSGYKAYIDMDLGIGHDTRDSDTNRGIIYPEHISVCQVTFRKENGQWKYRTT